MHPVLLKNRLFPALLVLALSSFLTLHAQQVTGVWEGRISNSKVEVKIIQKGDSLTGTSYYYSSPSNYRRYSIKGYFDPQTNEVIWWDDLLLTNNGGGRNPVLAIADFNCPGGGVMRLDGKAAPKEDSDDLKDAVHLTKVDGPSFPDEWDFIIDNYTTGTNDPDLIDSVSLIATTRRREPEIVTAQKQPTPPVDQVVIVKKPIPEPKPALTIEEKFTSREKLFTKEIPIEGDSIELRFYDNAQVDGDSISLFLNDQLIFTHVRLSDKAYTIKLPIQQMKESNELTMVAENLGSIPPNTSYMVAIVGDNRYDAQLASTENSSAMIRLRKK